MHSLTLGPDQVHAMRGRLLEDPIKEITAMQLIGNEHPNILGSLEVLQDKEYLYSVILFKQCVRHRPCQITAELSSDAVMRQLCPRNASDGS